MSYSLTPRSVPSTPTPRLYVVGDEMAIEGQARFRAPQLRPTQSSVKTMTTAELIKMLAS